MFIRATTITADPAKLEDGIRFAKEVIAPAVNALPGSLGMSMLVDRDSGMTTFSSGWESKKAEEKAQQTLEVLKTRAAAVVGGVPATELFELAAADRRRPAEPGFWSRMTRVSIDPHRIETAIDAYRAISLPAFGALEGFCSAVLLVDYRRGAGVSSVVFDSKAALDASREQGEQIRRDSTQKAGAQVMEVRESEIVIAGIQLPSTG